MKVSQLKDSEPTTLSQEDYIIPDAVGIKNILYFNMNIV